MNARRFLSREEETPMTRFRLVTPLLLAFVACQPPVKLRVPKVDTSDALPEFAGFSGTSTPSASPTSATLTTAAMLESQTRGPDAAGHEAQQHDQTMTAKAVTARYPQVKLEDSMNLNRVAEAFANAAPDMIVHTAPLGQLRGENGSIPIAFSATVASDGQERTCHVDDPEENTKLKSYGLLLSVHTQGSPPFRTPTPDPIVTCAATPAQIGADSPALIWSVVQQGSWDYGKAQWKFSRVVFVTPDGGRYVGSVGVLGGGPAVKIAPHVQDGSLYPADVEELTRSGLLAAKFEAQMKAAKQQWADCTNRVWNTYKPQIDTISASTDMGADEREQKVEEIAGKFDETAMKRCRSALSKYEAGLVGAIEQRNADRAALYDRVRGVPRPQVPPAPQATAGAALSRAARRR
jgi:hypothetical protein